MSWVQFSDGFRLDPVERQPPEALVVLLHDVGGSAAALSPIAARWAPAVPTTAFIALDGLDQVDRPSSDPLDLTADSTALDCATQRLEPLLERQLRFYRLDASWLVLAGFGYGGTIALHTVLRKGWSCAGLLAFTAKLIRPLPRLLRIGCKVRLIESAAPGSDTNNNLRDDVALLTARGIDARGVLLGGSAFSDETIRYGGAYLVELVATAQRSDNLHHLNRESSHAK
jgi:pimeloyl-ACP methyl ester carboxylesterase